MSLLSVRCRALHLSRRQRRHAAVYPVHLIKHLLVASPSSLRLLSSHSSCTMPKFLGCCRRRRNIKSSSTGAASHDQKNPTSPSLSAVVVPTWQHIDNSITSPDGLGANLPVGHVLHEDTTHSGLQASRPDATVTVGNEKSDGPQRETPCLDNGVMTHPTHEDMQSVPAKDKSGWSTVAYSTFKISLALTAEAAESFGPLKSAVGILSVLLTNYDVSPPFPSTKSRLDHSSIQCSKL